MLVSLALACTGSTLAFADSENNARAGQDAVADANTASTWRDWGLENSTENVGRIWTDKTVQAGDITLTGAGGEKTISKGDSTFLTALSAISSTSNLKSTANTPLDIVLVLDASGSMSDPMGNGDQTKRIDALKSAANSFIDEIAKQNAGVSDASKQHQVSIVKFAGYESSRVGNDMYRDGQYTYNYSQVMKAMASCTNDTAKSFKDTVNSIEPAGATRADNGMTRAQSQTSNRSDAKKIVIFFTDGTPTSFSAFNPEVASAAVTAAKSMKEAGASVYTIGIFGGADSNADVNSTSNENKFMQASSSNYPSATYANGWGGYTWNFGDRATGSDFYKSATNAEELKNVFDDISAEIVSGTGYPTDTREGYEDESGYITFTDQLGDYLQVDSFTNIVFANQVFSNPAKTTNGLVDTYTFTGEAGTALYPEGNLNAIDITVTRSENLQTGDLVEVKIPASLIPLRHFEVNSDGTGSVDLTFPIRVFYGSSLKAGVEEQLANPDNALATYIASNSAEGTVSFLANKWNGGPDGDTVANFTPSKSNSYYYITQDTPIYQDEACTHRAAAPLEEGKSYYYQRTWYDINNGAATQQTKTVSFDSGVVENINGYISSDSNGKAYFKAGTPRMTYINELNTAKSENITSTASTFINPKWAGEQVNTLLGNNGKVSVSQPGTLAISKTLEVPAGYNASDFADDNFEFSIAIPAAASTTLKAQVKNAAGEAVGSEFNITFDENGNATHSLKNGETLYLYGLAAGAEYTVTETPKAGFAQTAPANEAGEPAATTDTIEAGKTANADFTNTYSATGTLDGATSLAGEKVLTGRSWLSDDEFTFKLVNANSAVAAPMPDDGVVAKKVSQPEGTPADIPVTFNFGNITYTQPGTYVYEIHESSADSTILPGVSASGALYQVTVTVADKEHNGTLTVESTMKQMKSDAGAQTDQVVQTASFTNVYNNETETWAPFGTKAYTDSTGANPLKANMFHVVVCTDDSDAPMPEGTTAMPELGGNQWRGAMTSVEASGGIAFPQITYGFNDLQGMTEKMYTYKLMEVVENPASSGKWLAVKDALAASDYQLNGMQYDPSAWTVCVTIKDVNNTLELSATYTKDDGTQLSGTFQFSNSYSPTPATANIEGTKTLTGRDMAESETFGFALSAADKATQDAVDAGAVTIPADAAVSGAKNGEAKGFNFSDITFTKPGTYTFNVNETQWDGAALPADGTEGLTFDRAAKTVTVVVTDGRDGSLKAEVAYPEGGVAFANRYGSSAAFAGIQVSKILDGRTMNAGEFGFSVEGADAISAALLTEADRSFANEENRASGVADVMDKLTGITFTQADAGKTYEFKVKEVVPEGAVRDEATGLWFVKSSGVYYDGATHVVKISVIDNGKGQLSATTTVDDAETNVVSFVNKYRAEDVELDTAQAKLKKVLEGRDWIDSDSFTFTMKALTSGAPMPAGAVNGVATATITKENAENFGFGTLIFTADMLGSSNSKTFEYEVAEEKGNIADIDYATSKATVKVTVADNGEGKLTASVSTENGTFVNRYESSVSYTAKGGIKLAKTLNGRDMAAGQFDIVVTPANEESARALGLNQGENTFAMPAGTDGQQVTKQVLDGRDVVFTQADAGKTYAYTVTEKNDGAAGYTYDSTTYTVSIAVSISDAGELAVTTTVAGGASTGTYVWTSDSPDTDGITLAFTNSYKAEGEAAVAGTKTLTGRDLVADEFSFAVKYAAGDDDLLSATNASDGTISFGKLSYSTEILAQLVKEGKAVKGQDGAWVVSYVAYEKTGALPGGVTAQTQPISFTVTVVDNGDGTLTATPNVGNGLKFENAYGTDSAEVQLSGAKVLKYDEGLEPESIAGKFAFTVTSDDADAPMPEHRTAKNDADDKVDFGKITFTLDDLNKAWEKQHPATQSAAEEPATEKAAAAEPADASAGKASEDADPADGKVSAAAERVEAADSSNTVEQVAAVSGSSDGIGAVTLAAKSTESESPAAVTAEKPTAVDAKDAVEANQSNGPVAKASDPATQAGTPRSVMFTYKITESGKVAGIVNEPQATKTVTFEVTDDGKGKLAVTRVDPADESKAAFTFTNTYSVEPTNSSVTDQIAVTKQLTGRDLKAGEFSFELLEGGNVVAMGTNDAAGNVVLSKVAYEKPGTYTYTLREVGAGTQQAGVTYDGAVYNVATTVADNGNGTLGVTHKLDGDAAAATFTNVYEPATTSVTLGAAKVLKGKSLEANEFTFVLAGEDGSKATAKNDVNGNVTFDQLEFTKADTYHYTISEEKGNEAGVTYDETTYPVTVTVADDGQGNLAAAVSYEQGAVPVFTNTYQKPESPISFIAGGGSGSNSDSGSAAVKTGDDTLALAAVLVAAAGLAIAIAVFTRRRWTSRKK